MKACEICGTSNELAYSMNAEIYYCPRCQFYHALNIHYDKKMEGSLDSEQWFDSIEQFRKNNYRKILTNIVKNRNKENYKGLDVGSSFGGFIEVSKENNIEVDGIEPEIRMFDVSKSKGYNVINGFFPKDLPFDSTYDFISFNDVFEHIPNCNETMKHCHDRLNPNGTLILNIPVSTGILFRISKALMKFNVTSLFRRLWQFDFYTPHLYYFNENSIQLIAEKNGFELVNVHSLDAIDKNSIEYRVMIDKNIPHFLKRIIIFILKTFYRVFNLLPADIKVFYLKKSDK